MLSLYISLALRMSSTTRLLLRPEGLVATVPGVVAAEASWAEGLQLALLQAGAAAITAAEAVLPVRTRKKCYI